MTWSRPLPRISLEAFADQASEEFDRRFGVPIPAALYLSAAMDHACGRTPSVFIDRTAAYWRLDALPHGLASENAAKLAPLRPRQD